MQDKYLNPQGEAFKHPFELPEIACLEQHDRLACINSLKDYRDLKNVTDTACRVG